ncbi:MAG: hypothetical protein ACJAS0_001095 [Alcanivorax borkumensis]|jgi:hypothetical protein
MASPYVKSSFYAKQMTSHTGGFITLYIWFGVFVAGLCIDRRLPGKV